MISSWKHCLLGQRRQCRERLIIIKVSAPERESWFSTGGIRMDDPELTRAKAVCGDTAGRLQEDSFKLQSC
jgi:hypothetical protein